MAEAFICDALRTPIGRYGGALASIRADDLAAAPLVALKARHEKADWEALDDVIYGCVNQAGEDNRNVARMGRAAGGPADLRPRRHRQPALRLRFGGGRAGSAGDPLRRGRFPHCGRRREHDAFALRDAQG